MTAVTALMPLRNHHEDFLRKAVASMRAQTHGDWRLLVVVEPEDEDGFRELLAAELEDPRAALAVNEGRKLSGALNTGMRRAETPFVGILLSDDAWSPDAVEVLERNIRQHPEADFFHSSRHYIDEEDRPLSGVVRCRETFALEEFQTSSPVKHLLCWRRELALSVGGMDESLNCVGPDDWDFPWTMAERGARFQAIREPLYRYRDHRAAPRLTTHLPLSVHLAEIERILAKHGTPPARIRAKLDHARTSYLRQCLYRNRFHKWLKTLVGHDPRDGWRETYS